ncbi:hypothetical protein [Corallococcus carmarthensis]|uniref:hypothetical protein n=1 Tax=Corallococcus carmarthensis TaxID=2316728 RepID=UPI0011C40033|nr:hypothetical protein [Corallococcus carmarthensis]NOK18198.1 hypothetical protein [Corallococcus carmarthensis]
MSNVMRELGRMAAGVLGEGVGKKDWEFVEKSLVAVIAVSQPRAVLDFLQSMLWEVIGAAGVADSERQKIGRLLSGEYKLGRRMTKSQVEAEVMRVEVAGPAGECIRDGVYWFVFAARAPRDVLKFASSVFWVCSNYVGARVVLADVKCNPAAWEEEQVEQERLERDSSQVSKEERDSAFARFAMRARQNLPVQDERWAAWSRIADAFVMINESP